MGREKAGFGSFCTDKTSKPLAQDISAWMLVAM